MKNFLFMLLVVGLAAVCVTGCEKAMTEPVMDAMTPTETPAMDDPEMFTHTLVQAAIDLYKTASRDAAIAYHNDAASVDGQWYVFIIDADDIIASHAVSPGLVGRDAKEIVGSDGYPLGIEIVKATEEGHWINYLWHNPEANKLETKRTWVIRYDGYIFGSGYYEPWHPDPATLPTVSKDDPEAFTVSLVHEAIARYEFEGSDTAAAYYNAPANVDGQWYVFITDANDIFVAHPASPEFVGRDIKEILGLDGSPLGAEIAKATGAGLWIEYLWPNPETGEDEQKRTWAIRHDGYLFGSGYYQPAVEGN